MIETYPYFITKNQEPYFYNINTGLSHQIVVLKATCDDDLRWEDAKNELEQIKADKKKALIKLNLGLEKRFHFDSELDMSSYILAVEQLNKTLIKEFKDIIEGVIFYDGTCHFETACQLDNEDIADYLHENILSIYDKSMQNRLAAASILGSILHRLVSFLDESVFGFIIIQDATLLSPLDRAILFSKERFDHLFLIMTNPDYQYLSFDLGEGMSSLGCFGDNCIAQEIKKGWLLPSDAFLNKAIYLKLKQSMDQLIESKTHFRVIVEKIFNECWNDIDSVHYIPDALHTMTLRMVKGFEASGGESILI